MTLTGAIKINRNNINNGNIIAVVHSSYKLDGLRFSGEWTAAIICSWHNSRTIYSSRTAYCTTAMNFWCLGCRKTLQGQVCGVSSNRGCLGWGRILNFCGIFSQLNRTEARDSILDWSMCRCANKWTTGSLSRLTIDVGLCWKYRPKEISWVHAWNATMKNTMETSCTTWTLQKI